MEPLTGEVLNINNEYGSYQEYKAAVDTELQKSAESFVRIGYLLKVARDTDILKESGYGSVNEFAEAEYSLDKSQVSRFIRINDEYSEGGYSDSLQEKYRNFGYAKLAIMLTLPAAVGEELTVDYSKSEIQTIRAEIDEENKRTDIEVMLERKDERQQAYTMFGKVLYQIGRDRPELYLQLYGAVAEAVHNGPNVPVVNKLVDSLAPAGEGMVSVRIPGEGKMLLSIKGSGADPAVVNVRSGEKETCTWDEFIADMELLCEGNDAKESWKILYGEEFPEEKKEVAPVQPDREAKQAPKKPGRVTVSKPQTPEKTVEDNSLTKVNDNVQAQETTAQKEEEQSRDENMEVAPVQPENNTENPQNGTSGMGSNTDEADAGSRIPEETDDPDRVPPYIDGNDPESADAAPGAGSGNAEAVMGSTAGTTTEPSAAVLTQDVDGQISIGDMPQCMPDNTAVEQKWNIRGSYLTALKDNLDKVYILTERGDYQDAEQWLQAVRGTIWKIRDISEVQDG
ncbi:MAG: hypothetical protein HDR04_09030 [Lachnospiraceae bacterium]|nr:hypothetical protein [Lachnospiraceae bacterium]